MKPRVIVFSGYGLNCEEETKRAFELAGAAAEIWHINDLIASPRKLRQFQILAIPGGFSYGDDTGSGRAYANKLKNHIWDELERFATDDKLMTGICNGFQVLTCLGLLPGMLTFNHSARYIDRWVDLRITGVGPWLSGLKELSVPIAHGEGRYIAPKQALKRLRQERGIAVKYVKGEICRFQNLPANPNGSAAEIAGVTARGGRILGLMPHPERAAWFTQLPHWTYLREDLEKQGRALPVAGPGLAIFKNAVNYFS